MSLTSSAIDDGGSLLEALLEHCPCTVVEVDEQCRIVSINHPPAGMSPEGMLGSSYLAHTREEDRPVLKRTIEHVLRTGKAVTLDIAGQDSPAVLGQGVTRVLRVRSASDGRRALLVTDDHAARTAAEQALRRSEAHLHALVAASSDVVYRMSADWSEMRHLDGRGWMTDTVEPSRFWLKKYLHPEDQATVLATIEEAIRDRKPFELEHRVLRNDGSTGWTHSKAMPLLDDAGDLTEWIGMASDITARKQAQRALAESEERLRLALDAASEGLWDWNLITDECYFSPGYYAMLGYPPDALPRHLDSARQLMHPDDHDVVERGARLLAGPGHFTMRFRMRNAGGDYRWIEGRGKTVQRDARGKPVRAVGIHIDITERLRLEGDLRRSEALLRAIVEGTTDGIFVKDLEGRFVLVNRPALGGTRDMGDVLGKDDTALMPPEVAQRIMALDRKVMDEDKTFTIEETIELTHGDPRIFLTTKGPLHDDTGQVMGMFGIARDITELRHREAAQRQALEDSRNLLEMGLAGAELGTWDVDLVTGSARFDERYCAMLGYGPDELAPRMQSWQQLIHPDDRAVVDEAVRLHESGETRVYEAEHRLRHRQGHWVWVLARGKVLRDAQNRPVRAVGTHQDISDRKRVAAEGAALLKKVEELIAGLAEPRLTGANRSLSPKAEPAGAPPLSQRNREVLGLLAAGCTAGEIAKRLGITKETANTHRRNLMHKLGLRNKAELIR